MMPRNGTMLSAPVMIPSTKLYGTPMMASPMNVSTPLQPATMICPRK